MMEGCFFARSWYKAASLPALDASLFLHPLFAQGYFLFIDSKEVALLLLLIKIG
jgi:hypothetical protein